MSAPDEVARLRSLHRELTELARSDAPIVRDVAEQMLAIAHDALRQIDVESPPAPIRFDPS